MRAAEIWKECQFHSMSLLPLLDKQLLQTLADAWKEAHFRAWLLTVLSCHIWMTFQLRYGAEGMVDRLWSTLDENGKDTCTCIRSNVHLQKLIPCVWLTLLAPKTDCKSLFKSNSNNLTYFSIKRAVDKSGWISRYHTSHRLYHTR